MDLRSTNVGNPFRVVSGKALVVKVCHIEHAVLTKVAIACE